MSQSIQIQVTQVGLEQSIAAAMKRVGNSSQINLGTSSKQINALSQPLGRITGQADEFSKSMAAANARVLAFGASAGIIAGVSKAMSGLVTSTIKVEKSLVEINSVLNKTGAELDKFGQDIFNVAKNTGKSFDEVASGALELARQGLNAEDTLARLNDALILSRLSGLDAAQSVEGLTAAFNSFQKSGITTAEILNKVVAVSQKYAVSERDIIEGVKRSASVAQQAGVSFDELAAVITAVQQTTARGGAVIGNSFKTIFARIQRKDVLSDLQNMGVAVTDLQGNVLPALRILENLAGKLNNFSQIEQADIAEKLGGVFQLDKLLAALNDISDKSSVTSGALKVMGEAGNSAYQKNIILNQTLAALLNKVAVSAEQLGAKLGEIGVTDSLKNVLGIFNDLLEGIQKVLGEESGLGNLVRGLVKGLGSFLAGPGLALFGGIILKLSKDLVQFGFASLKTFFGIGKAAKEVQNVEGAISQILAKNVNLQQQLFALEGNRAAQLRVITAALVEQEAVLRRSSQISSGLAAPLYNVGARATSSGLRVGNSADGYMPAVAKESQAIRQGVGGARAGDKPVVIPNFSFGGGRKGTMVAHTGEYIVPNFSGSGGTAVFNRHMVQSMGLPSGAKKIGAAGGFVPNFAGRPSLSGESAGIGAANILDELDFSKLQNISQVKDAVSKSFLVTKTGGKAITVNYQGKEIRISDAVMEAKLDSKKRTQQETFYNSNKSPGALMLVPEKLALNSTALNTKFRSKREGSDSIFDGFIGGIAGVDPTPDNNKFAKLTNIDNEIASALSTSAVNILKDFDENIKIKPDSALSPAQILKSVLSEGGEGAYGAFKGALFESVIKLVTKAKGQEGGTLDIDFNSGRESLEAIFGVQGKNYQFADLKNSIGQKEKFISQVMTNLPYSRYPDKKQVGAASAASGFIPNFANPLQDAVNREMAAGVPASQIYIDKSPALKNAANPMGLMVANRRDEPAGGFQGINRARREGANPMMYGAASGFVPNYAPQLANKVQASLGAQFGSDVKNAINDFATKASVAGSDLDALSKELKKTLKALGNSNEAAQKVAEESKKQQEEINKNYKAAQESRASKILESESNKKLAKQLDKIYLEYNKSQKTNQDLQRAETKAAALLKNTQLGAVSQRAIIASTGSLAATRPNAQSGAGNRDMLGILFAVQGAMSALTGATDGASNSVARYGNIVSEGVGSFATAAFAIQGIGQMGGAIGGIASKLGPYGLAIAGTLAAFSIGGKIMDEYNGINKSAAASMAKVAEAAQKAAVKLEDLSPTAQARIKESAKNLVAGATRYDEIGQYGTRKVRTEFEGYDAFGTGTSEIEKSLQASVDAALAAGVSYDLMFNTIQEAAKSGGKTTKEEVDSMVTKFAELQLTAEQVKNAFGSLNLNIDEGIGKNIASIDRETFKNALEGKGGNVSRDSIIKRDFALAQIGQLQAELQKTNPTMDVNSPAAIKLMLDQYDMLTQKSKERLDAEREAIEQTQTSIVQDKLKNAIALSIAKARSFENDILGQQLLKGQELGNLSETALRNIQNEIALREINRELQDGTANLIQEQISQAKKITAESEDAIALEEKFKNLSAEQLQDRTVVNSLLQETSQLLEQNLGLNEQQKNALQVTLDKLFGENKIKKDNLALTQQQTEEYKQQARQLDLISQASKRALEAQSFRSEIAATRSINADTAQIRALESSKLGKSDAQVRQIDQQIAAIKENTVALEQGKEKQNIITQLQQQLIERAKFVNPDGTLNNARTSQFSKDILNVNTAKQFKESARAAFYSQVDKNDQDAMEKAAEDLAKFVQDMEQLFVKFDIDSSAAKAAAKADRETAGAIPPVINALEMFRRSLLDSSQIIDQKIEDIKLQQLTSISGKEILQGNYDIETLRQQSGQTEVEAARIARQRQNKGLGQLFAEEYTKTDEERALNINQAIVDGSVQFKNNMIEGIMGAIEGTGDLKDGLRSAAYEFVKMINQRMMSNLVDKLVGGSVPSGGGAPSGGLAGFFSNMFASGGKVTGGSGSKDDVPAMLMGGEYVVNKKAVAKYGPQFLEAINNGTLSGYAKGGTVQRGPQGNFYTPGTFGQGAISGKRNLLDFATQSGTSGVFDQIINESGYQAISLEPESSRLSVSGMRSTPMFEATQSAKGQAFDLYLQQYNAEREAKKQKKAQKKALITQLGMMALSAALGPIIGAGAAGAKAAFGAAKAGGATTGQALFAGVKGIVTGGKVLGQQVGGLNNLFSSVGKGLTGNFAGAANQFKLAQISNEKQLISLIQSNPKFAKYIGGMNVLDFSGAKRAIPVSGAGPFSATRANASIPIGQARIGSGVQYNAINLGPPPSDSDEPTLFGNTLLDEWNMMGGLKGFSPVNGKLSRAIGGMIPSTSGIDTVPAMLSGGEFVMNRSAVQSIGAPNLQSMNAGGTSITSEETSKELNEKLLAKLDELIKVSDSSAAGNITINVAPSGRESQESGSQDASASRQQLARQIKDAVLQVINDEKRIGGSLRR